jgi:hypothetical protein
MKNRAKALLDTNVWRYLADANAGLALSQASLTGGVEIVVVPAVVAEIRAFKDNDLRKRILQLLGNSLWTRTMPDFYSECAEVLSEIRRLRPHWINASPDLREFRRLRYDWVRRTGGFWERASKDIATPVTTESKRSESELELARAESKANRSSVRTQNPRGEHTDLKLVYNDVIQCGKGWDGSPVEYWRVPSLHLFERELRIYASPFREFLDCQVDVFQALADTESLNRLWLYELKAQNVPRQWLRGAFDFLQMWRSITPGSPVDSQLSTHLVDADWVVSADKNFVSMADRCHREAPFRTARARLAKGNRDGVVELLEWIGSGMEPL